MRKRLVTLIMGMLLMGGMLWLSSVEIFLAEETEAVVLEVGDTFDVDGLEYEVLSENKVAYIGGSNLPRVIEVPEVVNCNEKIFTITEVGNGSSIDMENVEEIYLPVTITTIQEEAFANNETLKKVVINGKSQLITIGDRAFFVCSSLEEVKLGSAIQVIGTSAFNGCSALEKIDIKNVSAIGDYAFAECKSLESVTVSNALKTIGEGAFEWCGLKEIQIPKSVKKINNRTFYYCDSLVKVVIPKGVKSIGNKAFYGCENVEEFVLNEGLTKIGKYAFYNCDSILRMELPKTLTTIGEGAFSECNRLRWINIPSKVKEIKKKTFSGSWKLTSIRIHDKLKKIHSTAFEYGFAEGGTIGYIVTIYTTKNSYFYKNQKKWPKDTGVTFEFETGEMPKLYFETWDTNGGEFVDSIYGDKYVGKSHHRCLKKDKWHKTIAYIPEATREGYIFKGWYTKKTGGKNIIKNKVTMAKDATYYAHWEKAKTYTVGKYKYQITKDKEVAFVGVKSKKTTKVTIPTTVKIKGKKYKVTSIAPKALKGNKKIKSIVITQNIRVIGDEAFRGCSKLAKITFDVGPYRSGPNGIISGMLRLDKVGDNIFKGIKSNAVIYIPKKDYDFTYGDVRKLQNKGQGKKVKFKKY